MSSTPDDEKGRAFLMEMSRGFWQSAILLTANSVDLFNAVADRPLSSDEAAKALELDPRATRMLMDALVALELLIKKDGRFRNTPVSDRFLVTGRPEFLGNILRHSLDMWLAWGDLPYVLRNGKPRREGPRAAPPDDAERTRDFIRGMNDNAKPLAEALMSRLPVDRFHRMLDVGGGPGTYSFAALHRNPILTATIFDLPATLEVTREFLEQNKMGNRIDTVAGDFNRDPLPTGYDFALLSQVLHSNTAEECAALIASASRSLVSGGLLVINEFVLNEDRAGPVNAALFSVNMLANTDAGSAYTRSEINGWMSAAGLMDLSEEDLLGHATSLIGRKP